MAGPVEESEYSSTATQYFFEALQSGLFGELCDFDHIFNDARDSYQSRNVCYVSSYLGFLSACVHDLARG